MSTVCDEDGNFVHAVTVPHVEVQALITKHGSPHISKVGVGDFVEILTGDAKGYHGTILKILPNNVRVRIDFPSGRQFLIDADPTSISRTEVPKNKQTFWGRRP